MKVTAGGTAVMVECLSDNQPYRCGSASRLPLKPVVISAPTVLSPTCSAKGVISFEKRR